VHHSLAFDQSRLAPFNPVSFWSGPLHSQLKPTATTTL
jgi:hypothetical protein